MLKPTVEDYNRFNRSRRLQQEFEKIYSFDNLYQAHKKARRGKQNKCEVIEFEFYLAENLEKLKYHLEN